MLLFLGFLGVISCSARPALHKPNIVMLFVDDLGYGDVGFTGHPTVQTPNIDALARGGKVLSSYYSGCPVCSGSRAALMTGRQFTRIGMPGVLGGSSMTGLPLNETTVADQLKAAGYATAAVGSKRGSACTTSIQLQAFAHCTTSSPHPPPDAPPACPFIFHRTACAPNRMAPRAATDVPARRPRL